MSGTTVDWRHIGTAPEPSTAVLVWDNRRKQCVVARQYHEAYGESWWMVEDSYGFNEDGEIPAEDITHWAALPNGPMPWDND